MGQMMHGSKDATPLATRAILLTVLAITVATHLLLPAGWIDPADSAQVALILWLFTGLFVLRVVGQILVALRPRAWLPPMVQWNFIPYPVLLPIQVIFVVVMVWINQSFFARAGVMPVKQPGAGNYLIIFSALYALAMLIRYGRRMLVHPDQRWFGGTIPIVFHLVLASYLYFIGRYHVSV